MNDTTQIVLAVVSSVGTVFILILLGFVCLYCWRRSHDDDSDDDTDQVDKLVQKQSDSDTRQLGRRSWDEKGTNVAFQSGSPMMRKKTIK